MEVETETADVILPNEQPAVGLENSTIGAKSDGVIEPVEKEAEVAKLKPKKKIMDEIKSSLHDQVVDPADSRRRRTRRTGEK
jgi:hypothetical protein